jgi:hypothetical protein
MLYNMVFKPGDTLNGASVFAFTSSTVTPSATSINVNPSVWSTSNTASSVIILETHFWPVRGNVQAGNVSAAILYHKRVDIREPLTSQNFWVAFLIDMILT